MIKRSIRRRIVAIAVGLIILMVAASVLSMVMVGRLGHLLDELTARYSPANTHLTRANIVSLERGSALRHMVIAKMQEPPDETGYKLEKQHYDAMAAEVDSEAQAARKLINAIIDDKSTPSDNAALARIDSRIDNLLSETRPHVAQEIEYLLSELDARDFAAVRSRLSRTDSLRAQALKKFDAIRTELLEVSNRAIETIRLEQTQAVLISAIVTMLAAIVGLFRLPCQRRHHSPRPTIVGGYAGCRGGPARPIHRGDDER